MNFTNVKLILSREIRDQLRDRRTLFMIFVLPVLLYPLLGMCFLQVQQLTGQQEFRIWVVGVSGVEELDYVAMLDQEGQGNRFSPKLFDELGQWDAGQLELEFAKAESGFERASATEAEKAAVRRSQTQYDDAWQKVKSREYDAALFFPHDFAERLEQYYQGVDGKRKPPEPKVLSTSKNDHSITADMALREVVAKWSMLVGEKMRDKLADSGVRVVPDMPVKARRVDVDKDTPYKGAAMWSKILPVLLLIWAMTGAFYPAVDLCAGEKERGTLETLLCSPAERSEIVLGKLATIMIFSMVTAVLNMISIGVMGWLLFSRIPELGPPPPMGIVWLGVALVPVSALFSALCLALAAFARSSKEGQYYLMPLLLITMPLAVLPVASAVELNMGTALVPVTGVVLLLRNVLEGNFLPVLQYLPVVAAVTLGACLLAIRWAVDQFNSESVLFRESEQLDVGLWLRHLWHDRQPTPTVAAAVCCAAVIFLLRFLANFVLQDMPESVTGFALSSLIIQVVVIAAPALLMALLLTSKPRHTLMLRLPRWPAIPAAVLLAVVLHPAVSAFAGAVQRLYPFAKEVEEALKSKQSVINDIPLWLAVCMVSLLPAICEELAFRGFVLSGLRHLGHKWRAIIYSALFFGITHLILQQSIPACVLGAVIGYLAVQSGSLLPGVAYHLVHNGMLIGMMRVSAKTVERPTLLKQFASITDGGFAYHWPVVVVGLLAAVPILWWFSRLPVAKSPEEELQDAIGRAAEDDQERGIAADSIAGS